MREHLIKILSWNTSSVTNMSGTFYNARAFQPAYWFWNTSSVTYMGSMFWEARAFNQSISSGIHQVCQYTSNV